MTRGPVFVAAKVFGEYQLRGGSVPVAKIFLPEFSSPTATPIRLITSQGNRRVAEARLRRPT
jgi:hypothetical protein